MNSRNHRLAGIGLVAFAATTGTALFVAQGAATGAPAPPSATEYVAPSGQPSNGDTSCTDAGFSTIQTAVDAAGAGGTVVVCKGTYAESVTLSKTLALEGQPGSVIDATNQPYGVGIAANHSTVTGLTVENATANAQTGAPGDGIITAGFIGNAPVPSNSDVITRNVLRHNQGAGIDLNSTSNSEASDNVADANGIGINVSNDLGKPAANNRVSGNLADNNPGGCGIVLADHTGLGVYNNVVSGNTANGNGLGTPSRPNASSGSGVILAAGGTSGGVYNNVIKLNRFAGNGHGGIALHAHSKGPNFSGNQLLDNSIGVNNKRTDYKDTRTTGIYLGDVAKLKIVVAHNTIRNDQDGIFTAGPITLGGSASNTFVRVAKHFVHITTYAG